MVEGTINWPAKPDEQVTVTVPVGGLIAMRNILWFEVTLHEPQDEEAEQYEKIAQAIEAIDEFLTENYQW